MVAVATDKPAVISVTCIGIRNEFCSVLRTIKTLSFNEAIHKYMSDVVAAVPTNPFTELLMRIPWWRADEFGDMTDDDYRIRISFI